MVAKKMGTCFGFLSFLLFSVRPYPESLVANQKDLGLSWIY